jgi:hypothetical protein
MSDQGKQRWPPVDLGPDEHTRLCPDCEGAILRRDEWAGRCPHCRRLLLSLAGLPPYLTREEEKKNESTMLPGQRAVDQGRPQSS